MTSTQIFSSNRCNICFQLKNTEKKQLSLCGGCKLIVYCGKKHQLTDFSHHKKFCNAIQEIIRIKNITPPHPFNLNGKINSNYDLFKTSFQLRHLLREIFKRNLYKQESDMLTFPRYCPVCYTFEIRTNDYDCEKCKIITYCSDEHKKIHYEKHEEICYYLHLIYNFNQEEDLILNWSFENVLDPKDILKDDLFTLLRKCNNNNKTNIIIPDKPMTSNEYQTFMNATLFSNVATILYAVNLCHVEHGIGDTLTIYIPSLKYDESCHFGKHHCKFLLTNLKSNIRNLRIYLISPRLKGKSSINYFYKGTDRSVQIINYPGYINDLIIELKYKEETHKYPNMIVCFDCGFGDTINIDTNPYEYDVWLKTISIIIGFNLTPIVLTSHVPKESDYDLNKILEISRRKNMNCDVIVRNKKNMLKFNYPIRNADLLNENNPITFSNYYMNIVITTKAHEHRYNQ